MKNRWLLAIITTGLLAGAGLSAEEVIFIPGAEIDGVHIGSFYLSAEEITNQAYFVNFIQRDGYGQKYLWDQEALQNFETFRNNAGMYAPRSWGNTLPVGQEYQPVMAITVWEARAYARSMGWIIPSELMWKRAQQVKAAIGPYPWQSGLNSVSAIRMARHFLPAANWEEKIRKIDEDIDSLNKNTAKISSVNSNAMKIMGMEKGLNDVARDSQTLRSQLQTLNDKLTPEKIQQLDNAVTRLAALESQVNGIAGKQEMFFVKQLPQLENQLSDLKKWEQRIKGYEALEKDHERLKGQFAGIEVKMAATQDAWTKKIQTLEEKLAALDARAKTMEELDKKVNALSSQVFGIEGKILELKKQNGDLVKSEADLRTSFTSMSGTTERQGKTIEELLKQLIQIRAANDDLGNKLQRAKETSEAYEQKSGKIEQDIAQVNKKMLDMEDKSKGWGKQFQSLQETDVRHEQQFFDVKSELKKQEAALGKEAGALRETINSTGERINRQDKNIEEVFKQTAQIKAITDDLNGKLKKCNDVDVSQSQKTEQLEQALDKTDKKIVELEAKDKEWQKSLQGLQEVDVQYQQKFLEMRNQFNAEFARVEKKNTENVTLGLEQLGTKLEAKMTALKGESDRQLQTELTKVSDSITTNKVELGTTERRVENLKKDFEDNLGKTKKDLSELAKKTDELQVELREGSIKLRLSMMKIGDEISRLFKVEGLKLPGITDKGQDTPLPKDEKVPEVVKGVDSEAVKKLIAEELPKLFATPIFKAAVSEEVQKNLKAVDMRGLIKEEVQKIAGSQMIIKDTPPDRPEPKGFAAEPSFAELCYHVGKLYYQQKSLAMSLVCMKLGYESDKKHPKIERFLQQYWDAKKEGGSYDAIDYKHFVQKYWDEINCPQAMVYVPPATITLGDLSIPEFLRDLEYPPAKKDIAGFYIDRHEVTRKEFGQFVREAYSDTRYWSEQGYEKYFKGLPSYRQTHAGWKTPEPWEENLPAVNINYYEAEAYAKWRGKRLPTPEEWEYAARGKNWRKFPWGDSPYQHYTQPQLVPVEQIGKDCSPFGIFGMGGNVSEWCSGYSHRDEMCRVKGGSYKGDWTRMQPFYQMYYIPSQSMDDVGFRCVQELEPGR